MAESFGTGAAYLTKDNIVLPVNGYGIATPEATLEAEGLLDLNERATGAYEGDNSYVAADIPTADGLRSA